MNEVTPVVDEDLLETVTLATQSCCVIAQPSIGKDIDIMRRVTSPPITASLHESPTPNQHSVEGPTSLEIAVGRLASVNSPIAIPGITGGQSTHSTTLPAASFCPGPGTQGIITAAIQVMSSEYLAALKKADLDAVAATI